MQAIHTEPSDIMSLKKLGKTNNYHNMQSLNT